MDGSAILAIAVSSEAMASAVKMAATAQRRRSHGNPSVSGVAEAFAALRSTNMLLGRSPGANARGLPAVYDVHGLHHNHADA